MPKAAPPTTSNVAKKVGTESRGKRPRESTGSDGRTAQAGATEHFEVGGRMGNMRSSKFISP